MLALPELQARIRRALLAPDGDGLADAILDDGLPAALRLDVYRNNLFVSLKQVLIGVYPVVCRLVDERFFLYAAEEFIRAHPPEQACLSAYGEGFPQFLSMFSPCRHLPYLADVARLEWLMHRASQATEEAPLLPSALAAVPASETPHLSLRLDPSLGLLESLWPVDRIWRANRDGTEDGPPIDLGAGGAHLEVRRIGDDVLLRSLEPGTAAFRRTLLGGEPLTAAAEAALALDPAFDLTLALGDLFRESAVVALGGESGP